MDAVADLGYYDQAHFIHDFKQYTSLTPNHFIDEVCRKKVAFGCLSCNFMKSMLRYHRFLQSFFPRVSYNGITNNIYKGFP